MSFSPYGGISLPENQELADREKNPFQEDNISDIKGIAKLIISSGATSGKSTIARSNLERIIVAWFLKSLELLSVLHPIQTKNECNALVAVIDEIKSPIRQNARGIKSEAKFAKQILRSGEIKLKFQGTDLLTILPPIKELSDTLGRLYQELQHHSKNLQTVGMHFTPLILARQIIHELIEAELGKLRRSVQKAIDEENIGNLEHIIDHLTQLRILDPACGSGVFLIAAFQAIYDAYIWIRNKIRQKKDSYVEEKIVLKQDLILRLEKILKNHFCEEAADSHAVLGAKVVLTHLYGVDLDPTALSIAKVNLWLEIVRYTSEYRKLEDIEPTESILISGFPFLDFNLVETNALASLAYFNEENAAKVSFDRRLEHLVQIKEQYDRNPADFYLRQSLKTLLKEFAAKLAKNSSASSDPGKLLHPAIQIWLLRHKIQKSAKGAFSIVCGNPPWGFIRTDSEKAILRDLFKKQSGQHDFYRYFLELAFALAESRIGFVTPNTWLDIPAAQKLRDNFARDWIIQKMTRVSSEHFGNVAANIIWFVAFRKENERKQHSLEATGIDKADTTLLKTTNIQFALKAISKASNLHSIIDENSRELGEIAEITVGYQLYHKDIHTSDEIATKPYHSKKPFSEPMWSEIRASSLVRFKTSFKADGYVLKKANFFRIPPERFLKNQRILLREIPSRKGLVAARTNQVFLCPKSILILILKERRYSYETVLSCLNSRLMQFKLLASGEKAHQRLFPRISIRVLSDLPIPISQGNSRLSHLCREIEALVQERERITELKEQETGNASITDRLPYLDHHFRERQAELNAQVFQVFNLEKTAVTEILEILRVPGREKNFILEYFSK